MPEETSINRRVALVTGGGKGIGRHIALRLARGGLRVAVSGRDRDALEAVVSEIERQGGESKAFQLDVTEPEQVAATVCEIERHLGPVEVAVCNAGIAGPTAACEDISPDDWNKTLAVNLSGVFYTCRAVLPGMKAGGRGRIILISSTTAKRPVPNRLPYAATKMGMIGFGRSLAAEVGSYGITVNTICPGVVEGERWDRVAANFAAAEGISLEDVEARYKRESLLKRFVTPEQVADLVYFLCHEGESITGQDINICAGLITY